MVFNHILSSFLLHMLLEDHNIFIFFLKQTSGCLCGGRKKSPDILLSVFLLILTFWSFWSILCHSCALKMEKHVIRCKCCIIYDKCQQTEIDGSTLPLHYLHYVRKIILQFNFIIHYYALYA